MAKKPDTDPTLHEAVRSSMPLEALGAEEIRRPAQPVRPAAEKLEPHQWAEKLGNMIKGSPHVPHARTFPNAAHAVADQLHGWSAHRHHYQTTPLLLAKEDYEAALEAAGEYPAKPPHAPAMSQASTLARRAAAEATKEKR